MSIKNFDELIKKVKNFEEKRKVAIVVAEDKHTLEAAFAAMDDNILEPVLIGNGEEIKKILKKINRNLNEDNIIDVPDAVAAAYKGIELASKGDVDFIMKGKIQTADFLRAVVDKEKGLRTGNAMSHFVINEVPSYHKLLVTTDGGMITYPDVNKKKEILENAVNVLLDLGYEKPKVAVLAAAEVVNPKIIESVDAGKLKEMNQNGEIINCIVEGPISYDLTMSKESARIKGYNSPVTGEADILISPNITAGNILGKCLLFSAGARMAGFIVGAKVPIVMTSRGASSEEKYLSLALCAAASK